MLLCWREHFAMLPVQTMSIPLSVISPRYTKNFSLKCSDNSICASNFRQTDLLFQRESPSKTVFARTWKIFLDSNGLHLFFRSFFKSFDSIFYIYFLYIFLYKFYILYYIRFDSIYSDCWPFITFQSVECWCYPFMIAS